MKFSSHPKFDKQIGKFLSKHNQDDGWIFKLQNILTAHYEKQPMLGETRLAQVGEYKTKKEQTYRIFKVYMAVGGVKRDQAPRVCFAKYESTIIFLCSGTHIENYSTKELVAEAKELIKEFVGE